jgi:hypothetical protein
MGSFAALAGITETGVFEAGVELATRKGKLVDHCIEDHKRRVLPDDVMDVAPHSSYCLRKALEMLSTEESHDDRSFLSLRLEACECVQHFQASLVLSDHLTELNNIRTAQRCFIRWFVGRLWIRRLTVAGFVSSPFY